MIYSIDLGNSTIKWAKKTKDKKNNTYNLIPSYVGNIQEYDVESLGIGYNDDSSAIFKYISGPRKDLKNTYWISGYLAKDMRISPLFLKDKHEYSLQGVLSVLCCDYNLINDINKNFSLEIIYSIPDHRKIIKSPQEYKITDFIKKELIGTHRIEIILGPSVINSNNKVIVSINIKEVKVVPEGYGGYIHCVNEGLVNTNSKAKTLLVDVGTRTCILTPFSERGIPIMNDRIMRRGVQELVSFIREGKCLREADIFISPDEGAILEGIENNSFIYENTGISFKKDYLLYCEKWCSLVKTDIRTITKQCGNVNELLFIGGGASLFNELSKITKRIKVCPNARFANVLGMLETKISF
ncbi:hypothetical protein V6O07_02835 [Arthrospira platensis SPKY2]